MNEHPVPKEKSLPSRLALGMDHAVGIADRTTGIAQELEWELEFVRECPLVGNGIHGNSEDFNFLLRKCRKCRPQRLDLLDSSRRIGLRVEEHDGPGSGGRRLEIYFPTILIWCRESRRAPTGEMRIDILVNGTSREKCRETQQGKVKEGFHRLILSPIGDVCNRENFSSHSSPETRVALSKPPT